VLLGWGVTRIGSLCTGYGGLDFSVDSVLGTDTDLVWYADTDPDAAAIGSHHWPTTPNLGDITEVDWTKAPSVDIITAGFPCQPFSCSGKKHGSRDPRHLWPTGVLPAITALRPQTLVLENVPGLLTAEGGNVFRTIINDLTDRGYRLRWTTAGACAVGACHHRHRIFIMATREEIGPPAGELFGLPLGNIRKWPKAATVIDGEMWSEPPIVCGAWMRSGLLPTPTARDADRGAGWADRARRPLSEVVAGLDSPVDLLPTPTASDSHGPGFSTSGGVNLRTAIDLLSTSTGRRWGKYAESITRQEAIFGSAPDPLVTGPRGGRRLSARFVEWMMMLPSGWVTSVPGCTTNSGQTRALGNGVVPAQASLAVESLGLAAAALV